MNNLPMNQLMQLMAMGQNNNLPQLNRTNIISRKLHGYKLEDLLKIAELESNITEANYRKLKATLDSMALMMDAGNALKHTQDMRELEKQRAEAILKQEQAKVKIMETESKKEEFDLFRYMESFK